MSTRLTCFILSVLLISSGCANVTAPTGGRKDIVPPKLVSLSPQDSMINTRVSRIELYFDEYITLNSPTKEIQLSPILPIAPTVTSLNKHVIVKIVDSLLEPNTTYRLTFGEAIKDLHEGNIFKGYTYTFSTGAYFDSLQLNGSVTNAATGLYDLEGVWIVLYYATDNDSAVVRQKPRYVAKVEQGGQFSFKGLPRRAFRMYALKDANENLTYDGPIGGEMIGFLENNVVPGDTGMAAINIRVFSEELDTASRRSADSLANAKGKLKKGAETSQEPRAFTYSVNVDTSNRERKTFDITGPIKVAFNRLPALNKDKITLMLDSNGVDVPVWTRYEMDSVKRTLNVNPLKWKENSVYTLRLAKGFAKDSAGNDLPPSRHIFRTMDEDDYGDITMHLPAKYKGDKYLFRVQAEKDSIYQKPVTDTIIKLRYLKPGKYTFRVIADRNRNGKWDAGKLLEKIQPEEVIPYRETLDLKAGWKHTLDFEEKKSAKPGMRGAKDKK